MKRMILILALGISGYALASGMLNLWTNQNSYAQSEWLGGDLEIQAVQQEGDQIQLRIKLTGAGSLPAGSSQYYTALTSDQAELPLTSPLKRSNASWEGNFPTNYKIDIDTGDLEEITGEVFGYEFETAAIISNTLNLWTGESGYSQAEWLGGDLQIQAIEQEEEKIQLRIKLTGAGSVPEGSSQYYTAQVDDQAELPVKADLKRANSSWQGNFPTQYSIDLKVGTLESLEGEVFGYEFETKAAEED